MMTVVRPFEDDDSLYVKNTLRLFWRMEVPKQFNLSEVVSQQPLAHCIVGVVVFIVYLFSASTSTVVISLPLTYILLFLGMLFIFLFQANLIFLKELEDIHKNFQSNKRANFWVITEGEGDEKAIIGALSLLEKNSTTALIRHIYVKDRHANHLQMAKLLLRTGLDFAKENKYSEVELWTPRVSDEVARLYHDMGLKLSGDLKMPFRNVFIMTVYVLCRKLDDFDLGILSSDKKED